MKNLRLLLIPFSFLYGLVVFVRNKCYDLGIFSTYSIPKKSICVGNLSVGGTGKTPHVDLILSHFIEEDFNIAVLSRGYGRKTKGLLEVNSNSTAAQVGDEPLFYKLRHGEKITAIVAEERKLGVEFILNLDPKHQVTVLDDAFQHRAVKAGLNIIITEHDHLFTDDYLIPAGNLREWRSGIKRADLIIVSKCPKLSEADKGVLRKKLKFNPDAIYFSEITYDPLCGFNSEIIPKAENILLVTGIGNPQPLLNHLAAGHSVEHLKFNDHHAFTESDIVRIHEKFDTFASRDKIIVTTEKDFMRIKDFDSVLSTKDRWFYQPITTIIDEQEKFNRLLDDYVREI
ncbi:MAG: tetraacyldisaccharide 4'-kinase [Crocinitomicaceae bacterium]|nr:tetraacyldisaccharide 4'-kinase [Crocinitomicaceae bacterium]